MKYACTKTMLFVGILALSMTVYVMAQCRNGVCSTKPPARRTCPTKAKTCPPTARATNAAEPEISTAVLKVLIDAKVSLILLDARTGKYDDGRRIPGAKSLSAKATIDQAKAVIPSTSTLVVTYCSNLKCPASHMLYRHLKNLGYQNLLEYPEGIQGWAKAGHLVIK